MLASKLNRISYSLKKKILTVFGDIKVYPYPGFVVYNPKHYALTGKDFDAMCRHLRPYDVVLRRFDAYLDTGFIPGFWNHAGVVGPGMKILHAVAEGVREESLFDFMKADHICLLRPTFSFDPNTIDTRAMSILNKEYDFDFDFENGDRLSCTELVRTLFEGFPHEIPISEVNYFLFSRKLVIPDTIVSASFETIYDSRWV